jgi:hypothetical protein
MSVELTLKKWHLDFFLNFGLADLTGVCFGRSALSEGFEVAE